MLLVNVGNCNSKARDRPLIHVVLTDALSASAGYKALSVDYDEDGHVFDATLRGPVLGLTWRF